MTPPAGLRSESEGDDGEELGDGDGDGTRGRGDQGERVARAGVVADATGDDGGGVKDGQVVDLDVHRAGDAAAPAGGAMAVISLGEMLVMRAAGR